VFDLLGLCGLWSPESFIMRNHVSQVKEAGPPPPSRPRSQKDSQRAAYPSTLTLDTDSNPANHPKVVASVTLCTCTSEMVWIRLASRAVPRAGSCR
jgi:hypothetical protein